METEFLEKAEENIKAAQVCFDNGLYNACANRVILCGAASCDLRPCGIRE